VSRKPVRPSERLYKANDFLKTQWDRRLTVRQNLTRLGLKAELNSEAELDKTLGEEGRAMASEAVSLPPRVSLTRSPNYVRPFDAEFIDVLVAKHGSDYKAMQKDIKTNVWQWSAARCERMIKRLELFRGEEDRGEKS
jgi:hypothetical protein